MSNFNTELEKWFENFAHEHQKCFPSKEDFVAKYKVLKDSLNREVYPHINAALAQEGGLIFTDHGPDHFESVINAAGDLLNVDDKRSELNLNAYEVYILLVTILLHDAGNIIDRETHTAVIREIFVYYMDKTATDILEVNSIADIARAHGGKSQKNGSLDTIRDLSPEHVERRAKFRPQLIAALLRFADEICEDSSRACSFYEKIDSKRQLPEGCQIFHKYASSIKSSLYDFETKFIHLKFCIFKKDLFNEYGKMGPDKSIEKIYLLDEIYLRINKMYKEWLYCNDFFDKVIEVKGIKVTIHILTDDTGRELKKIEFDTEQFKGYPTKYCLDICEKFPEYSCLKLQEELNTLNYK